jgi:hypothetical protein
LKSKYNSKKGEILELETIDSTCDESFQTREKPKLMNAKIYYSDLAEEYESIRLKELDKVVPDSWENID